MAAMSDAAEGVDVLRARVQKLEQDLADRTQYVTRLEKANREMESRLRESGENSGPTAELSELEETLRRLVMRVAMILQGSRCLFMIQDPKKTDELFAETPSLGFEADALKDRRVKIGQGVSGECFETGQPIIVYDAQTDDRSIAEGLDKLGVRNGVCVPLVIEKRDEETNRVIDRRSIGVLHVFDKKYGNLFIQEDVQLLERLARNAASIINNAEQYRTVVREKDELVDTIESLYAGLVMVNRNGRITQMNASARRIFGIKESDLAGGKTYDAVIKEERIKEILRRALTEEAGIAEEITLSEPDNADRQRTFQVQSALVRNEASDLIGTAAIFNDITELKNVDKMKTAFVSTVSHELRTPLTAIKGFTSTLLLDEDGTMFDNQSRREFYGIIESESDRLTRLITDLLNVSRLDSGAGLEVNFTTFDIRKTVAKVITIANGSTYKKEHHTLTWEVADNVPKTIEADEDKVEQILHNIIGNALKYSPEGGNVHVKATLMAGGELVQFAISDQGMGMTEEFLKKVGEKFIRQDNRDTRTIGGTGLGLFLTKALIEAHNGSMWPHSEGTGKGSTFFFTLPIKQSEAGNGSNLTAAVSG